MIDLDRLYQEANESWNHAERIRSVFLRIEQETRENKNLLSNYMDLKHAIKEIDERIEEMREEGGNPDSAIKIKQYMVALRINIGSRPFKL